MKTFQDMVAMGKNELRLEYEKATREVLSIKLHIAAGQERDTAKLKKAKRYVAQILTAMNQQQLSASFTSA